VECSSHILAVCKGPNKWRFVQDLWLVNEAVIPLYPIVPNPYTLLTQVPPEAQYYSVLDLKDAFFCIPLHPDSQPLFAFEDPTNPSQQLTWTVFPQGFRDSPHPLWASPNQRLKGLATPRGHPYPVCWWPTLVCVHWASCFQSNWIPFKFFGRSSLQSLKRKSSAMPSSGYLPWHDPGRVNQFLKSWMD
jgi:hypothetical protein